jgi:hypothetical protein
MKACNRSVLSLCFGLTLILLIGATSSAASANTFESVLFTYLEKTNVTLPPGPIAVNGVGTVKSEGNETVQVPGCTDGDMTQYPIQKFRGHLIPKKHTFTPGGPVFDAIIISQTDPLPEGTHFQVFFLEQCTSGGQLYNKILAGTVESLPFIPDE